jgi:hypothetical protein
MSTTHTTTKTKAQCHEALYPRLAALGRQIAAIAARRPAAIVPEGVRILAEGLLFDIRPFLAARPRRDLPVAAPDYGALATQLGQALAALDVFEARHTSWHAALKCFVWRVRSEEPLPVGRLRPQTVQQAPSRDKSEADKKHRKVMLRIQEKWDEAYERGKRDGALEALAQPPQIYPRALGPL